MLGFIWKNIEKKIAPFKKSQNCQGAIFDPVVQTASPPL
jgi:hypothetical protein